MQGNRSIFNHGLMSSNSKYRKTPPEPRAVERSRSLRKQDLMSSSPCVHLCLCLLAAAWSPGAHGGGGGILCVHACAYGARRCVCPCACVHTPPLRAMACSASPGEEWAARVPCAPLSRCGRADSPSEASFCRPGGPPLSLGHAGSQAAGPLAWRRVRSQPLRPEWRWF